MCLGLNRKQIALQLRLSRCGVASRVARAYAATGASSPLELGMWCVVHGVVSVEELRQVYAQRPYGQVG